MVPAARWRSPWAARAASSSAVLGRLLGRPVAEAAANPADIVVEGARKAMTVRAAVAAAREAGRKYISVASEILGEAAA